ncbi:MAG: hypothetical protein AAF620_16235 [Bacteroidota bacterium]
MDQLVLFPDRIAVDKNFSPNLTKDHNNKLNWAMDFEASFGLPREPINDVLLFLLKKCYDNPIAKELTFTIKEVAKFNEKTPQVYNKLTFTKSPDINETDGTTYINNLEVILYRLTYLNLRLTKSYILPKKDKAEMRKNLKTIQILQSFTKTMIDGKTKKYAIQLNPYIVKNLSLFLFYTSHEDYKKVSKKGRQARSWKLYYMNLNSLFNNLLFNANTIQPSFDEIKRILSLNPNAEAKEHKRTISNVTKYLLGLPSLQGLKMEWVKTGRQRYPYTPKFSIQKELVKGNPLLEDEKSKFRRVDLYLICELKDWNIAITNKSLKENRELLSKAFKSAYTNVLHRDPSGEEYEFLKTGMYKGRFDSALRKHMNGVWS